MNRVRIVAMAAATLGIAVAAGTFLQAEFQGPASPERVNAPAAPVATTGETALAEVASAAPQVSGASVLPGMAGVNDSATTARVPMPDAALPDLSLSQLATPRLPVAPDAAQDVDEVADLDPEATIYGDNDIAADLLGPFDLATDDVATGDLDPCAVWLVVTPEINALLQLSLYAPCDGDAVVTIAHGGLRFDESLGADGQLDLSLPALNADGMIQVTFADMREVTDAAAVTGFALHDRVAIQWQGPAFLDLNAYEFGADFGAPGHVSPSSPSLPGADASGFLISLGDPTLAEPRLAQVYSFPSGLSSELGAVELEIEAAITDASCGQPLSVETLETRAGNAVEMHTIALDMPECDGMGGFLVLKNLLPELTIALN